MNNKSDFLRNALVDHTLRGVAYTPPSARYIALFTVAPTSAGGGTEVTGGSYLRQSVAFSAASSGQSSNTAPVNFPVPSADWGTVIAAALFDASSGGNMLYFGPLGTSKTIYASDSVFFPANYFSITES